MTVPGGPDWRQGGWRVWRQLPVAAAGFTGRTAELATLDGWAADGAPVLALTGPAGVGKTALALRWAAGAARAFPDGQLHLDLAGFGPDRPVPPAEALGLLLRQVGVPERRLPAGLADRTAEWRTVLAHRRVLLVLDNARDADQVRPLLAGTTVVTSRDQLRGLVIREGARRLRLGPLSRAEARALLARAHPPLVPGDPLAGGQPAAVPDDLLELCAGSPLALRAAGERAARHPDRSHRPGWTALNWSHRCPAGRGWPGEAVPGAGGLLGLFDAAGVDVRTVLSWSYRVLDEPARLMFRLLGLCPGGEVTVNGAAALTHLPLPRAAELLDRLANLHLVEEETLARYRLDPLAAGYAAELAQTEPPGARRAALRRLLDHIRLHTDHDLRTPAAAGAFHPPRQRPPSR